MRAMDQIALDIFNKRVLPNFTGTPSDYDIAFAKGAVLAALEEIGAAYVQSLLKKWKKIGEVNVDSAGLMICDPSYIDKFWEESKFVDVRCYVDKAGKIFGWGNEETKEKLKDTPGVEFFETYQTPLKNGIKPNDYLRAGEWEEIHEVDDTFSDNGCFRKGGFNHKQIKDNLAVAFSIYGDGTYEVFARENDYGQIVEVRVTIME